MLPTPRLPSLPARSTGARSPGLAGVALATVIVAGLLAVAAPAAPADDPNQAGVAAYERGDYERAAALFRDALERDDDPTVRRNLGHAVAALARADLRAGRLDRAGRRYAEAADLVPDEADYRVGRAVVHLRRGDLDPAATTLERALARDDDHPGAHATLARVHELRTDLPAAIRHLERALDGPPADEDGLEPSARARLERRLARLRRDRTIRTTYAPHETNHFSIRAGPAARGQVERVGRILEAAWRRIGDRYGIHPPGPVPVILYESDDFREVRPTHAWVGGLFDGTIRVPAEGDASDLEPVLRHEYVHAAIVSVAGPRCPGWIHEGLAQLEDGRTLPDLPSPDRWIPLTELSGGFAGEDDPERARAAYAEAAVACRRLVERSGRASFIAYLQDLGRGVPEADAFERAFGRTLADLSTELRRGREGE